MLYLRVHVNLPIGFGAQGNIVHFSRVQSLIRPSQYHLAAVGILLVSEIQCKQGYNPLLQIQERMPVCCIATFKSRLIRVQKRRKKYLLSQNENTGLSTRPWSTILSKTVVSWLTAMDPHPIPKMPSK